VKDQPGFLGNIVSEEVAASGISRGKFIYYLLMVLPVLAVLLGACGGGGGGGGGDHRQGHP
jgi:hypothetical protein